MEVYHQRKEKVTCVQWYLFNDFSITPIEQVIDSFREIIIYFEKLYGTTLDENVFSQSLKIEIF